MKKTTLILILILSSLFCFGQKAHLKPAREFENYEGVLKEYYDNVFPLLYQNYSEKPIARYGRPICEMLLRKLSKSNCVPLEDDINWSITKGKRKNYIEVRRALKHLMVFAASYYLETKDKEFMECFLNSLNSLFNLLKFITIFYS
mgnify:CR=1 FL=1